MCNGQATGGVTSEEEEKPQVDGNRKEVVFEEDSSLPLEFEAKNGDTSLITEAMAHEEVKLLESRVMEEMKTKQEEALDAQNPNFRFSKLDELLTQTQLYSEFLLEKMDDITFVQSLLTYLIFCTSFVCFDACLNFCMGLASRMAWRTMLKQGTRLKERRLVGAERGSPPPSTTM